MLRRLRCVNSDKALSRSVDVDAVVRPSGPRRQVHQTSSTACAATSISEAVRSNIAIKEPQPTPGGTYVSQQARQTLFSNAKEQVTEVEGSVVGTLPAWLRGSLIVNGGAAYDPDMAHLFDGFGMCVKLRVDGQRRVWGAQRFIQSKAYKHYAKTGRMKWREFGSPPKATSIFQEVARLMQSGVTIATGDGAITDNASVNLVPLRDGSLLACSETSKAFYRVDPKTLETLGPVDFPESDGVEGTLTTAHPKCMADGTLVNFMRNFPNGGFNVFKQDPHTLKRTLIASIKDRVPYQPAWVHDSACSEHYLVISEMPLLFNLPSLVLGRDTPYVFMDWKPELGTRVHLVALDGSGVQSFDAPAWFTFHFANAHEAVNEDGAPVVHLDMSLYPTPEVLNGLRLDRLKDFPGPEAPPSSLHRLTIPLGGGAASGSSSSSPRLGLPAPLVPSGPAAVAGYFDFPAVAPSRVGKSYRYVYGTTAVRPTNMSNALVKVDITNGSTRVFHEPGGMTGEPLFVARPGGSGEDDGVVLSVLTMADGRSAMLVLDAKDFVETARAVLPFAVPYRFHGVWLQEQ